MGRSKAAVRGRLETVARIPPRRHITLLPAGFQSISGDDRATGDVLSHCYDADPDESPVSACAGPALKRRFDPGGCFRGDPRLPDVGVFLEELLRPQFTRRLIVGHPGH